MPCDANTGFYRFCSGTEELNIVVECEKYCLIVSFYFLPLKGVIELYLTDRL